MLFGNKPLLREEYWGGDGGGYVAPTQKKKNSSSASNNEILKTLLENNNIGEVHSPTLQEELHSMKNTEKLKETKISKFGFKL